MEEKTICSDCEYVMEEIVHGPYLASMRFPSLNRCMAERSGYTGYKIDYVYCAPKNKDGKCKDFKRKERTISWLRKIFKKEEQ